STPRPPRGFTPSAPASSTSSSIPSEVGTKPTWPASGDSSICSGTPEWTDCPAIVAMPIAPRLPRPESPSPTPFARCSTERKRRRRPRAVSSSTVHPPPQQRNVQCRARLRIVERDAEAVLQLRDPSVERGSGQVSGSRHRGLVPTMGAVETEEIQQLLVGRVPEQRSELALGEGPQPRVLGQQRQQTAQADVRCAVERAPADVEGGGDLGDLGGGLEPGDRPAQGRAGPTDPDDPAV